MKKNTNTMIGVLRILKWLIVSGVNKRIILKRTYLLSCRWQNTQITNQTPEIKSGFCQCLSCASLIFQDFVSFAVDLLNIKKKCIYTTTTNLCTLLCFFKLSLLSSVVALLLAFFKNVFYVQSRQDFAQFSRLCLLLVVEKCCNWKL